MHSDKNQKIRLYLKKSICAFAEKFINVIVHQWLAIFPF